MSAGLDGFLQCLQAPFIRSLAELGQNNGFDFASHFKDSRIREGSDCGLKALRLWWGTRYRAIVDLPDIKRCVPATFLKEGHSRRGALRNIQILATWLLFLYHLTSAVTSLFSFLRGLLEIGNSTHGTGQDKITS